MLVTYVGDAVRTITRVYKALKDEKISSDFRAKRQILKESTRTEKNFPKLCSVQEMGRSRRSRKKVKVGLLTGWLAVMFNLVKLGIFSVMCIDT